MRVCFAFLLLAGPLSFSLESLAASKDAGAQAPVSYVVRTGEHPTFDRIVFDARPGVTYQVRRSGGYVELRFSAPGTLVLPQGKDPLTRLRSVRAQNTDGAPLVVSFSVDPKAEIKDFTSGASIAIDVLGPAVKADAPRPAEMAAPAKAPAATSPAADQAAPAVSAPAPKEQEPKPTEPKSAPAPASKQLPPAVPQAAAPAAVPSAPATEPAPAPAPTEPPAPASPLPPLPKEPSLTGPVGRSAVQKTDANLYGMGVALTAAPQLVASFDPKIPMGVVVFARGGYVTILFDRKLTLTPAALTADAPLKVTLTPIELGKNTGYRFPIPPGAMVRATQVGTAWKLFMMRMSGEIGVTSNLIAQPDFALGARLLMPTLNAPEPVNFTDPVVGDDLILLPLREPQAFTEMRRLVDISLLPSAQGLVIKPMQEHVIVRQVADGIEITAEGGLKLSPMGDVSPTKDDADTGSRIGKTLFDFASWRGKANRNFTELRQDMMRSIMETKGSEKLLARLALARLYFANGLGDEALSILDVLEKQEPDLAKYPEFFALRGAARILAGHVAEGLADLNTPDVASASEAILWQGVAAAELRDWNLAFDKFSDTILLLKRYPDPFFARFMILAVESALATNHLDLAKTWLSNFDGRELSPRTSCAVDYLKGALNSLQGHANQAASFWRRASHGEDRLYKIRAELALTDLAVASRTLTPSQAAERLEGLRFAWRGDDLELDILRRLGDFYLDASKYRDGLGVLSRAVRLFPNAPMTPLIQKQMAEAYRDLFMGPVGAKLSPIEALDLYREYGFLKPAGPDGYKMGQSLAERLVSIDLLDQAADILDDQVKNNLTGEDKSRVGARSAGIRLLDHKGTQALAALENSAPAAGVTLPADLVSERQMLRARALFEMKKYDEALALLDQNTSAPALALRADILMRAERWSLAAEALLRLVGAPPAPGKTLSPNAAEAVLNSAIAYSLAGNGAALDKLAVDYSPSMDGLPQQDMFRILTRPEKTMQAKDLRAAEGRLADVDLFRSFLDAYRSDKPAPMGKK